MLFRSDPRAIAASIVDGLGYGCGDAVIGINPATDNLSNITRLLRLVDELIHRHEIPTQGCVLAHITSQMEAIRRGAPLDLMFQSIAGTEAANTSFGVTLPLLAEARAMTLDLKRGTLGNNVMYFETGQGSALSSAAHHGADQVTLEARCYGFARRYKPFLVNTVVGFIGPEYLEDGPQITRAGLEDHFMGKLLGLPMGCDACFTYHARMSQDELENLKVLLGAAGCTYLMSLPVGDDIMLNYQSTSFHDIPSVRGLLDKRPAPEFDAWLADASLRRAPRFLQARSPLGDVDRDTFDVVLRGEPSIARLGGAVLADASGVLHGLDALPHASRVHAKVVLLHGPDDRVIPASESIELARRLPAARLCLTPLLDHGDTRISLRGLASLPGLHGALTQWFAALGAAVATA